MNKIDKKKFPIFIISSCDKHIKKTKDHALKKLFKNECKNFEVFGGIVPFIYSEMKDFKQDNDDKIQIINDENGIIVNNVIYSKDELTNKFHKKKFQRNNLQTIGEEYKDSKKIFKFFKEYGLKYMNNYCNKSKIKNIVFLNNQECEAFSHLEYKNELELHKKLLTLAEEFFIQYSDLPRCEDFKVIMAVLDKEGNIASYDKYKDKWDILVKGNNNRRDALFHKLKIYKKKEINIEKKKINIGDPKKKKRNNIDYSLRCLDGEFVTFNNNKKNYYNKKKYDTRANALSERSEFKERNFGNNKINYHYDFDNWSKSMKKENKLDNKLMNSYEDYKNKEIDANEDYKNKEIDANEDYKNKEIDANEDYKNKEIDANERGKKDKNKDLKNIIEKRENEIEIKDNERIFVNESPRSTSSEINILVNEFEF